MGGKDKSKGGKMKKKTLGGGGVGEKKKNTVDFKLVTSQPLVLNFLFSILAFCL